jgi:hypothetical protein
MKQNSKPAAAVIAVIAALLAVAGLYLTAADCGAEIDGLASLFTARCR